MSDKLNAQSIPLKTFQLQSLVVLDRYQTCDCRRTLRAGSPLGNTAKPRESSLQRSLYFFFFDSNPGNHRNTISQLNFTGSLIFDSAMTMFFFKKLLLHHSLGRGKHDLKRGFLKLEKAYFHLASAIWCMVAENCQSKIPGFGVFLFKFLTSFFFISICNYFSFF